MIDAVTYAVDHYIVKHGLSPDSTLSTSIARDDRTQRIFRGKFRRAGRQYMNIKLSDIPKMVIFLLHHSYLTVGTRSIYGKSICTSTVDWWQPFRNIVFSEPLSRDAGLPPPSTQLSLCGQPHHDGSTWMATTPTLGYLHQIGLNPPTLLEEVDDSEILGCHVTEQRSIAIRQPLDLVTLRSGHSQDSDTAILSALSAFLARALLIIRYTFPLGLILPQLEDLLMIFARKHVSRRTLLPTVRTILKFLRRRLSSDLQTYRNFRRQIHRLFADEPDGHRSGLRFQNLHR